MARIGLLVTGMVGFWIDLLLKVGPRVLWLAAGVLLLLSIVTNVLSWIAAKARRTSRRNARRYGMPSEQFRTWGMMSSWTWDTLSIALLGLGVSLLTLAL